MPCPPSRNEDEERSATAPPGSRTDPLLLALAVEQSSEGIAIVDLSGNLLFVNRAFANLHGYEPGELLGRHLSIFHTPAQMPAVEEANSRIRETGSYCGEVEHVRRDGTVFLTQMHNSLVYGRDGSPVAMIGTLRDITAARRTEKELEESRALLRQVIDLIPHFVFAKDREGRFLLVNRAGAESLNLTVEELTGRRQEEVDPDREQVERMLDADREVLETDRPLLVPEQEFRDASGRTRVLQTTKVPFLLPGSSRPAVLGVAVDITGLKQAEQALRESEERYAKAERIGQFGHWEGDFEDDRSIWSPALHRIFGLDPAGGTPSYRGFLEFLHPADRQAVRSKVKEAIRENRPTELDYRIIRADGEERCIHSLVEVRRGRKGGPGKVFGILQDVTERRRAEAALRQSEERWRSLTENSPDFILLLDQDGVIRFINRTFYQPAEQVVGSSVLELTVGESREVVAGLLERVRETGRPAMAEARYQNPGGSPVLFELRVGPILQDGEVTAFVLNGTEIGERKRIQAELAKVQQLESLGVLAGGVAHDFNNILTAIMANLSLLRLCNETGGEGLGILAEAETAVLRARGLTQQLLAFAKGGAPLRKPTNVAGLIRDTTEFCLSGSNVRCAYSLPEDLWAADADAAQIGQVIQNLVINADQAMPEGGLIRVSAENVTLGEGEYPKLKPGSYVRISVEDRGSGIPEALIPKIFDPFFTTKERGRGLGLAITFSVINRHEGAIQVESRLGTGSTFQIYLPASGAAAPVAPPESPGPTRGRGRVLLVDDEEIILRAAGEVLKRLGYQVTCAGDGAEAVESYRRAGEAGLPFDAVIMDLTIPGGMGGREAIGHLREIDPRVKVIVSSGYSDDLVMSRYRDFGFSGVLVKPYTLKALAETLQAILRE